MRISEIFYSVQGEGDLTGVPSVFVRTSGCNLRCVWCDTPYASWQPEGPEMSVDEIVARVLEHPAKFVVLTGGEPMIARDVHALAARLGAEGRHITIETAGTIAPNGIRCDLASISPKLASSTPSREQAGAWSERHERSRWRPEIVAQWLREYPFQLKFVVQSEDELGEIEQFVRETGVDVPPHKILLMPEGRDPAVLGTRGETLVEVCKRTGYRYCERLHIRLFGNVRGT